MSRATPPGDPAGLPSWLAGAWPGLATLWQEALAWREGGAAELAREEFRRDWRAAVRNVVLALSGVAFLHFLSALVFLGVGWNFAFIGGTTLLTQTYRPAEQMKVQAVNEFSVFGLVALATLLAGWLYDRFGWVTLNLAVVPLLLAALSAAVAIERQFRRVVPAA